MSQEEKDTGRVEKSKKQEALRRVRKRRKVWTRRMAWGRMSHDGAGLSRDVCSSLAVIKRVRYTKIVMK